MNKVWIVEKLVEEVCERAWTDIKIFATEEGALKQFKTWMDEIREEYIEYADDENEGLFSYELVFYEGYYSVRVYQQEMEM